MLRWCSWYRWTQDWLDSFRRATTATAFNQPWTLTLTSTLTGQVLELREKGLSTKVIALANAAWIRYMTGKGPIWGDAILGVSFLYDGHVLPYCCCWFVMLAQPGVCWLIEMEFVGAGKGLSARQADNQTTRQAYRSRKLAKTLARQHWRRHDVEIRQSAWPLVMPNLNSNTFLSCWT